MKSFSLPLPLGISVSDNDTLFAIDGGSKRVMRLDDEENNTWTPIETDDPLKEPHGVCVRGDTMWVSEAGIGVVSCWRNGQRLYNTEGEMKQPCAVCVSDDNDELYVASRDEHCVCVFDATNGSALRRIGEKGDLPGQFRRFDGICLGGESSSSSGRMILVSDFGNNRIQEINVLDGSAGHVLGSSILDRPQGIAYYNRKVITCDKGSRKVMVFEQGESQSGEWRSRSLNCAAVKMPLNVATTSKGELWITCVRTGRLLKLCENEWATEAMSTS